MKTRTFYEIEYARDENGTPKLVRYLQGQTETMKPTVWTTLNRKEVAGFLEVIEAEMCRHWIEQVRHTKESNDL